MPALSIPNIFVSGTTINSAPFNANFNAVATSVNNVDNSQIGAAGIFASQIIPTSSAFATFGGTVGYSFYNATAGVTPLTVSGVAGQSVDIFDVTLTSGGTNAFKIASAGAATFASTLTAAGVTSSAGVAVGGALTGATSGAFSGTLNVGAAGQATVAGDGGFSRGASSGRIVFGGGTTAFSLDAGVTSSGGLTFQNTTTGLGVVNAGLGGTVGRGVFGIGGASAVGGYSLLTTSSGIIGTSGVNGGIFCIQDTGTLYVGVQSDGKMAISGTAYLTSSSRTLKKNIQPLVFDPVGAVRLITIKSWHGASQEDTHPMQFGPIAEELPDCLHPISEDGTIGTGGYNNTAGISLALAALKIVEARVMALEIALQAKPA